MSTLSERTSRRVFVGLVLLALGLFALLIRPLAMALFLAAVLAGALSPLHVRLSTTFRGRSKVAAGILVLLLVVIVLAPVGGAAAFLVKEAGEGYRFVTETVRSEGMSGLLAHLPDRVEALARKLLDQLSMGGTDVGHSIGEQASSQGGKAARAVTGLVTATGALLFQSAMMLIALFFMLTEGRALVDWLEKVVPLKPGQTKELLLEFRKVSVAVLVSSLATAFVQAAAALIGYLIARVPHPFFFGLITFFIALIPAVGAAAVCLAAALLLLATGHMWSAIFLAAWGVTVVGLVDNVIKPILVKRGMSLHGAIVFFALLGGLAVFGPAGLLLGPLIVALLLALIRINERDYQRKLPPFEKEPVDGGAGA